MNLFEPLPVGKIQNKNYHPINYHPIFAGDLLFTGLIRRALELADHQFHAAAAAMVVFTTTWCLPGLGR